MLAAASFSLDFDIGHPSDGPTDRRPGDVIHSIASFDLSVDRGLAFTRAALCAFFDRNGRGCPGGEA